MVTHHDLAQQVKVRVAGRVGRAGGGRAARQNLRKFLDGCQHVLSHSLQEINQSIRFPQQQQACAVDADVLAKKPRTRHISRLS